MKKIQKMEDIYKEVLTILAYFNDELIEKIPAKVFKELRELAADSKANFYIDTEKDLDKQDISEESKNLISLIYYSFIADEKEKRELLKMWNENETRYQEILREKYSSDRIFQNRTKETSMIEYKKETLFDTIKKFIKKILKASK